MTDYSEEGFRIFSSQTALKFYIAEGWTKEILRECLETGDIVFHMAGYWTLQPGAFFNLPKLMRYAGQVFTHEDECLEAHTKTKYLKSLNGVQH